MSELLALPSEVLTIVYCRIDGGSARSAFKNASPLLDAIGKGFEEENIGHWGSQTYEGKMAVAAQEERRRKQLMLLHLINLRKLKS